MAGVELNITIIGAGIAGLGAAITLSKAGHNVTVLEKSQFKREAGFMITLGSNAIRVLQSFDFDFVRARSVDCEFVETYDGHTLEQLTSHGMEGFELEEGLQARTFYRPDLHSELKRIALLRSPKFKSPVLRLGSEVVAVDIQTATVELKGGTTLEADLVIGADGERSMVKDEFKDGKSLRQAPYKIFRAIVPTEKLSIEEGDRTMMGITSKKFALFLSGTRTLSWFEGRDGLLQDLEAGYMLEEGEDFKAETHPGKAYTQMLEKFKDYHPDIVSALRKAERVTDWEVYYSRPIPHLHKHKAVLIGDAAHSMYPTTGQGGSQSLEDVCALGILLSNLGSKSDVESRLEVMESLRKDRASIVQALSGIVFGTEEEFAKARPWHKINQSGIKNAEQHMQFLYGYNILEATRKALDDGMKPRAHL